MFKRLTISDWRQIGLVDLEFHPQFTVITGSNGSGKTTILHLLSRHYQWLIPFVSTRRRKPGGVLEYGGDRTERIIERLTKMDEAKRRRFDQLQGNTVGVIEFSDGAVSKIVQPTGTHTYQLSASPNREVNGVHISSHRPVFSFHQLSKVPVLQFALSTAYTRYTNLVKSRYNGHPTAVDSPILALKEVLVSLAMAGVGGDRFEQDPEAATALLAFEEVLRKVLPPQLGFRRIMVRLPEVILETATGDFSLDASSGGVAAVIDLAWRVFSFSHGQARGAHFVVTIDEPESHLHPAMQQSLLPSFLAAFPNAQFIVATHSPFIISSVPESSVYALQLVENRVDSLLLSNVDKAGTANDILREVLGLPFTMPLWADIRLQETIAKFSARELSSQTLSDLRKELEDHGLGDYIPGAIAKVVMQGDAH